MLNNNAWNHLTVRKQISSDLFKDATYKLFALDGESSIIILFIRIISFALFIFILYFLLVLFNSLRVFNTIFSCWSFSWV